MTTENTPETPALYPVNPVKPEFLHDAHDPINLVTAYALPPAWTLHNVDNEQYQPNPRRAAGTVQFVGMEGFLDYVNAHQRPGHVTTLWATNDKATLHDFKVTAVLNDHADQACEDIQPGWRDFQAVYQPVLSEEFKTWLAKEKEAFSQAAFAEYLEDNIHCITNFAPDGESNEWPSGADMHKMALNLEIKENAHYRAIMRPQSGGIELTYTDGPDAETVQTMKAYDLFAIRMPIYQNGQAVTIKARLRYRLKAGVVTFHYKFLAMEKTIRDQIKSQLDTIGTVTGLPVYLGSPKA